MVKHSIGHIHAQNKLSGTIFWLVCQGTYKHIPAWSVSPIKLSKRDEVFCLHFIYIARKWEFSRGTSNVPEFFKDLLISFLNFKILKSLTYVSKFHVHHLIKNYLTINLRLTINHYFLFSIVNVSIKL